MNIFSSSSSSSTPSVKTDAKATTEVKIALLLALCAYAGRLARSSVFAASSNLIVDAADLWYEQAIWLVTYRLREHRSLESIQVLLLCALRNQGKGDGDQAWDVLGRAVRMGQALRLDLHRGTFLAYDQSQTNYLGYKVWGVTVILDLFLSLQLRRPPGIYHDLRSPPTFLALGTDNTAFAYTLSLCRIISCINQRICLDDANTNPNQQDLIELESKLKQWERVLPQHFKISDELQSQREVIELNMLYQFALILLYRRL